MERIPASSIQHNDLIVLPDSSRPHRVYGIYPSDDGEIIEFEIEDHLPIRLGGHSKMITVKHNDLITRVATRSEEPSETEVRQEIRHQIEELMHTAGLSAEDRSSLRALVGHMSDGDDDEYDDFMLMYLSGDRDWRADHQAIFGGA